MEVEGKLSGFDGICDKAHVWIAGGHSNKTWLMVSSEHPHKLHWLSHLIFLYFKLAPTDTHPEIACQIKCRIYRGYFIFQTNACRDMIVGPKCNFSEFLSE